MKYSEEWGSGKIISRDNTPLRLGRRAHSGGSGIVFSGGGFLNGFCLKLVSLLDDKRNIKNLFFNEAKSVSLYTSAARNIPGCVTCPIPAHYWIHENDALCKNISFPPNVNRLSNFISLFRIQPEQLDKYGIDPEKYCYIPADLLNTVYHDSELAKHAEKYLPSDLHKKIFDSRIKADILLTYPVLKCNGSIEGVSNREWDDVSEIGKLIYQILSSILALYRNGLAHGDIKPANIMFTVFHQLGTGKKPYRNYVLTDIGSVHSGAMPSKSGTKAFFHSAVSSCWRDELEAAADDKEKTAVYRRQNRKFIGKNGFKPEIDSPEELNTLLCRTLMDGFALAATIWTLAYGQAPQGNTLVRRLVSDRWHNPVITEAFNTLYEISDLSIAKMQKTADDLAKEFSLAGAAALPFKSVATYGRESEFKFDVKLTIEEEIQQVRFKETEKKSMLLEYGYLAEQFNVSGMCNPAVRCNSFIKRLHLPENCVMQPIINAYSNGSILVNSIYYAPDDAVTGNRVTDFEKYIPRTLDYDLSNNKLDDAGIDELLALGAEIDRDQNQQSVPRGMGLPYPQDIVKIDGQWKLQPFFLNNMWIHEQFSMEEYFKMLCGRKNALTVQNWINLIDYDRGVGILYNLIPQDMVRQVAELLNTKKSDDAPINLIKELRKTKKFGKYL